MVPLGQSAEHEGLRYYYEMACTLGRSDAKRILKFECATNALYEEAWEEAEYLYQLRREQHPSHPWYLMKKEYFVAIMCYMLKTPNISGFFNEWCRSAMPTEESWRCFPLKSLFFFLIKAFDYLPPHHVAQVYRADPRFPVNKKKKVHFVHFLSASAYLHQALKFGNRLYVLVLLDIPAALIRDVSMYSGFPKCKEVIIWPFCVFSVVAEQHAVKTLVFDPKRSWTEPRQVIASRITKVSLAASRRPRRPALDEPSTSGAISCVGSAEHPRMSELQSVASLDAASGCRHATDQGKEPEPAAVHSVPGTSGTSGRDARETTHAAWRTTSTDRLRKIIDEIRRDFVITIPRREHAPGRTPAAGGPVRDADTMRATINAGSFAAGETHDKPDNAERSRQVALSVGDDTDERKVSSKHVAAVVCMALIFVASAVLLLNKFAF